MDTATKTGIDGEKTASKTVVQKLQKQQDIRLQIKQQIKLLQQTNQKTEEIYIPPQKRQKIIDDLKLFRA